MKKIIIAFGVLLVAVVAYNFLSSPATVSTTGPAEEGLGSGIRNSLKSILPGGDDKTPETLGRHEEGDHVVVVGSESNQMEVEDVIERIESLKDSKEHEGLDFTRWTLFSENAKFTPGERERILERASEILPAEEVNHLHRDVLYVGSDPGLFEESLNFLSKNMNQADTETLIKDVLGRRKEPAMKAAVIQFAAFKNIYVKD